MAKADKVKEVTEKKLVNIDDFLGSLVSEYRSKGINVGYGKTKCEFVDTGNLAVNYMMSGNFDAGLPVGGQVIEVHGDSQGGKSVWLYTVIAKFLEKYEDGVVILDDAEHAYVEYLDSKIKIDEKRFIRFESDLVEEHAALFCGDVEVSLDDDDGFEKKKQKAFTDFENSVIAKIAKKTGSKHILVALDSVAVLSTRHEQKVGMAKPDMGKAKQIKALLRLIHPMIKKHNVTYIVINHLIQDINSPFPRKVTPGGTGVPYASQIRINMEPSGKIRVKETGSILGLISRVTCVKNRYCPPFRSTSIHIRFDSGIYCYSGLIDLLKNLGVVKDAPGGWYEVVGANMKFQNRTLEDKWPAIKEHIMSNGLPTRVVEDVLLKSSDGDCSITA